MLLLRRLQEPRFLPGDYQLVPQPRGALGNLVPRAVDASQLQPGQAAVRVAAVGLNFRDVLNVLGGWRCWPGCLPACYCSCCTCPCT